jgi:hypothetical protein
MSSCSLERVVDPFAITGRRGLFEALHSGSAGSLAQSLRFEFYFRFGLVARTSRST